MKIISSALIILVSATALYGCSDGGNSNAPIDSTQGALYHPKNLLVQSVSGVDGGVVRILGEDDTLTTCKANNNGSLSECITQELEDADAVFQMVANPRNGALYFLQYGVDSVLVCDGSKSSLSSCATSNGGGNFKTPRTIGFNAAGTMAYIANRDDDLVVCQVAGNGSFSSCTVTDANGTLGTPVEVGLAQGDYGTHAYFLNGETTPVITACALAPNGMPGICRAENDPTFTAPTTIAFTPNGKHAYVGNLDDSIAICQIGNNASLNACSRIEAGERELFAGIQEIAFDNAGANAYIVNARNSSITHCKVNADGAGLNSCNPYRIEGFLITTDLALNEGTGWRTLFLTSVFDQAVYGCALDAGGNFGESCTRTQFALH